MAGPLDIVRHGVICFTLYKDPVFYHYGNDLLKHKTPSPGSAVPVMH